MKTISFNLGGEVYRFDVENPLNIAIPLDFAGAQPNAYAVEKAQAAAYQTENLIGDTRRGGSCNFERAKLIPHCNGTHTECVGHITHERISVHDCLKDAFTITVLVTIKPENARATDETYAVETKETDRLITKKSLESALRDLENSNPRSAIRPPPSIIVRTLPNDARKLSKTYLEEIPPFFSTEAMLFLRELEIKHLLVDAPSIDRLFDEGKLPNHRIFWNVKQGSYETSGNSFTNRTITELIYVPDRIADGVYLLNLQIAPFASDAAPSRPVLFKQAKSEKRIVKSE